MGVPLGETLFCVKPDLYYASIKPLSLEHIQRQLLALRKLQCHVINQPLLY